MKKVTKKDIENLKRMGFEVVGKKEPVKDPIVEEIKNSASVVSNAISVTKQDLSELLKNVKEITDHSELIAEIRKAIDALLEHDKQNDNNKDILLSMKEIAKIVHESILFNTKTFSESLMRNTELIEEQSKQLDLLLNKISTNNKKTNIDKKKWEMIPSRNKDGFLSKVTINEL